MYTILTPCDELTEHHCENWGQWAKALRSTIERGGYRHEIVYMGSSGWPESEESQLSIYEFEGFFCRLIVLRMDDLILMPETQHD